MTCPIRRHGETHAGTATVTLERGALTFVASHVPAMVCANRGEVHLDLHWSASEQMLRVAEEAAASGVQVDVRAFRAGSAGMSARSSPEPPPSLLGVKNAAAGTAGRATSCPADPAGASVPNGRFQQRYFQRYRWRYRQRPGANRPMTAQAREETALPERAHVAHAQPAAIVRLRLGDQVGDVVDVIAERRQCMIQAARAHDPACLTDVRHRQAGVVDQLDVTAQRLELVRTGGTRVLHGQSDSFGKPVVPRHSGRGLPLHRLRRPRRSRRRDGPPSSLG